MLQWVAAIAIGVVPSALLATFWFGCEGDDRELFLAQLLFWSMPAVLLLVTVALLWRWRGRDRLAVGARWRTWLPALGIGALLTVVLFWLVPPTMRVQFDETSLVGASQNMQRLSAAVMTTGALPYDGAVLPLENTVDKRPPLFAFLVHLLHRVAGCRVENAFVVNGALLTIGLAVAFAAFRRRLGLAAAVAAPLCLLAAPLTCVVATSAGFELMAAVWFLIALLAALDFVRQPDNARFAGLLAAGMLFAQSRYESLPAALVLAVLVGLRVRGRYRASFGGKALLACCVPLLLPLLFLLSNAQNPKFYPEAAGAPLLAWSHFAAHVGPFVAAWFAPSLANVLPGVLALLAIAVLLVRGWRRQTCLDDVLIAAPVLAVTGATLSWFFSDVAEPAALRLFLPAAWACALVVPLAFAWLSPRMRCIAIAALAGFAGLRVREVALGRAFPELETAAMVRRVGELAARLPGDRATTLWIGMPAQYLIVQGHAALSADGFLRRRGDLQQLRQRGDLRTLYFVQTALDDALAPAFGRVVDLLPHHPVELVDRLDGELPISVYRLR